MRGLSEPSEEDAAQADRIIEWLGELEGRNRLSDYLHNLLVLSRSGIVGWRSAGIAASAAAAYRQEIERKQQGANSHHVGTVGERREWTLTLRGVHYMDGAYGTTALYTFHDPKGNLVKWFASNGGCNLEVGRIYTGKATVKKHDLYEGTEQTLITRAALALVKEQAA